MMQKKIGKYWFSCGRIGGGFGLGIVVNKYFWNIDLVFWYVGGEF